MGASRAKNGERLYDESSREAAGLLFLGWSRPSEGETEEPLCFLLEGEAKAVLAAKASRIGDSGAAKSSSSWHGTGDRGGVPGTTDVSEAGKEEMQRERQRRAQQQSQKEQESVKKGEKTKRRKRTKRTKAAQGWVRKG